MIKLPPGMTKTPILWDVDPIAFLNFVDWSIENINILNDFLKETGVNVANNPTHLGMFCDWLVVNLWGEDEQA